MIAVQLDLFLDTASHVPVTRQRARPAVDAIFRAIVSAADLYPEKSIEEVCEICRTAAEDAVAYEIKEGRLRLREEIRARLKRNK